MANDPRNPPIIVAHKHTKEPRECPKCRHKWREYTLGEDKEILKSIAYRALHFDRIDLHVTDANLGFAENILKLLRRFGWGETKRDVVKTFNTMCLYNEMGKCTNDKANFKGECNLAIRSTCKFAKQKSNFSLIVNQITIEPIPGIKSLD